MNGDPIQAAMETAVRAMLMNGEVLEVMENILNTIKLKFVTVNKKTIDKDIYIHYIR